MTRRVSLILLLLTPLLESATTAQETETHNTWPWHQWIESDFPFFSTVVDARFKAVADFKDNLTPRALVFPLGHDCLLAYDVDLLRVAVVWTADELPFFNAGMAVNSYPYQGSKVDMGLDALPKPSGEIWFQNGIYPGVGLGEPQFTDPRPSLAPEERVVRGGLEPKQVRFLGIDLTHPPEIQYEIGGKIRVGERFSLEEDGLLRHLRVGAHREPVFVVLAKNVNDAAFRCHGTGAIETVDEHVVCRIPPSTKQQSVSVLFARSTGWKAESPLGRPGELIPSSTEETVRRWNEAVRLPFSETQNDRALNLERIPLPLENAYGRGVRAAAVDFFKDGRAALVTFDGDVWLCDGLRPGSKEVVWTRFTSGLHEPLNVRIRDEEIFVFDRNGLWRLLDRDKNGEADYHELFCSRIDQTAETREFTSSLEVERDGSFLVCKSGQMGTFGAILRISPDGGDVNLVARGFRQPFLGYDPVTGQIAASDQQGHWVPSTPLAFIKQGGFYGFPHGAADNDTPVTPPLIWLPHQECASAVSVVWMRKANMGPLNGMPILLSYQPPRLLQVHTDVDEFAAQGGATPLDLTMDSDPLLDAAVNPADGLLYLTGFKIWGTKATRATFFGRVRTNPAKAWTIPTLARVARRGILLHFDVPLDPASASKLQSYTVRRWNYKRTSQYGSAHYRLDGATGTETLPVTSAKLSSDGRSVFLGISDMREVMQIEVSYRIASQGGVPIRHHTFLTAHRLRDVNLPGHGFSDNEVDLRRKDIRVATLSAAKPSVERGALYYTQVGCVGCHSVDGSQEGKNGPSWFGLYGSQRKLMKTGRLVTADEAYLRESILNPTAKIAAGAVNGEAGMPIYAGVLSQEQIESLLLYIKALADKDASGTLVNRKKPVPAPVDHRWKVDDFRDQLALPLRSRSFEQGKLVFLGASCFACHQIGEGKGGRLGPDLAKLDEKMRGLELLTHILEPSRKIDDKFKSRTIITVHGKFHQGFVISEDEVKIRIAPDPLASSATTLIRKKEIDEMILSDISAMPLGTLNRFDEQQVLDLLAYIESCANPGHPVFTSIPLDTGLVD